MKIAVDGFDLNQQSTGVGRYLKNLLPEIVSRDPKNRYTLFVRDADALPDAGVSLETKVIPFAGGYTRWQNGPLLRALRAGAYEFLFAPGNQLPLFFHGRTALTVHDVAWRVQAGDFSFKERTGKDWKCRWSVKRADRIFTDAECTKNDLIRFYRVGAEKIKAIPLAIEPGFRRATGGEVAKFKKQHRLLGKKCIGFLGSMFGRRHIRELIDAFRLLNHDNGMTLMLVGKNSTGADLEPQLRSPGIVWRERLPEKQLNLFYSSMDLLVYASDYEGFGFPPLEALACGTASLLLATSSLKEIYHDLACFVDSPEPPRLAEAIRHFLKNKAGIEKRIRLCWQDRKGYFTWSRVAADYLAAFFG